MKNKLIKATALMLTLSTCMSMTACQLGDKSQGDEIEEMLEDEFGGNFKLKSVEPRSDLMRLGFVGIPSYYEYVYEWDKVKGNDHDTVYVTNRNHDYRTDANYVLYYEDVVEYLEDSIEDCFPGGVLVSYCKIYQDYENGNPYTAIQETDIEKMDFDDILDEWELQISCVIAVKDPDDHEAIERIIDRAYGDYRLRIEAHIISIDDVDDVESEVNLKEKDDMELFFDYKNNCPKHEYYLYLSDTKTMKGATGWYEAKGKG